MTSTIPRDALHHDGVLLLPVAHGTTFSALKADYEAAIREALVGVQKTSGSSDKSAVLDVAIGVNEAQFQDAPQKSANFSCLQKLLSNVYKLVGSIAIQQNIELDFPRGVDVRVFLLSECGDSQTARSGSSAFPSVKDVSSSGRSWTSIWTLDTAQGIAMAEAVTKAKPVEHDNVHRIRTSFDERSIPALPIKECQRSGTSGHYSVAVGGTFDHLHIGHKLLLSAVWLAIDSHPPHGTKRLITVGVTGDALLVNKQYAQVLEPWERRWEACWKYYETILGFLPSDVGADRRAVHRVDVPGPNGKYVLVDALPDLQIRFVQISDLYGPTITDQSITALVVSGETRAGGKAVNKKRREKGWKELEIFEVDVLNLENEDTDASQESFESKISSTEIRKRMMKTQEGSLGSSSEA
ncbi:hypothetical protein KEM54_006953 [Ascosphaera aggregata]|nr:hypothetical protein KEM54_006953 [Ascosphaera aggregata]